MFVCAAGTSEAAAGIVMGAAASIRIVLGTAAELPPGAAAEGTGGRAAGGLAAGVFRGALLGLAAPCLGLCGDEGRLGYSRLAEVSLREVVKTASGPTAR